MQLSRLTLETIVLINPCPAHPTKNERSLHLFIPSIRCTVRPGCPQYMAVRAVLSFEFPPLAGTTKDQTSLCVKRGSGLVFPIKHSLQILDS